LIGCIRSGKAYISSEALHHKKPCCLSLRVPMCSYDTGESMAFAAIQFAERYQEQCRIGKTRLDRIYLFRWLNEQR
jgi:predicted metalloprotease